MKFLLCLLLLLPSFAIAAIYKCVDQGQVTYSASPCGDSAQILPGHSDAVEQPQSQQGTLALYLRADHSYRVPGRINNHALDFVVDTGASTTFISQRVAMAAGIKSCTGMGYAGTANGKVRTCVATIPDISFGMFHFNNLMVTILPDLSVDALLGMDVLRHLKVEQHDDVMFISN